VQLGSGPKCSRVDSARSGRELGGGGVSTRRVYKVSDTIWRCEQCCMLYDKLNQIKCFINIERSISIIQTTKMEVCILICTEVPNTQVTKVTKCLILLDS
jgi:hypothetical protein